MRMVTCDNGHYYDQEKNSTCPYCANSSGIDIKTKKTLVQGVDESEKTALYQGNGTLDDEKTVYNPSGSMRQDSQQQVQSSDNDSMILLSGWLVIISDKGKGENYTLTFGMNTIGRSENNHISIQNNDATISRERHAIIIYDYDNNIFFIKHGEGQYLSYLNGEVLIDTKQLKANDRIKVGSTELIFIPLCSDQFKWKESRKQEESKEFDNIVKKEPITTRTPLDLEDEATVILSSKQEDEATVILSSKQEDEATVVIPSEPIAYFESVEGTYHKIYKVPANIGKSKTNDIVIERPYISRQHAVLIHKNGYFYISDDNSSNGVTVNGRKIQVQTKIEDGVRIGFGPYEGIFRIANAEEGAPGHPEDLGKTRLS